MRAIDADKVVKWSYSEPRYSDSVNDRTDLRDFLLSLPTLSPDEVRGVGKWIAVTNGRGGHECGVCHDYAPSFQDGSERLSNFCPNCGAAMLKGE